MADMPEKDAALAAKEAEKAAKKAKQERIKQSKPKKEGTVFSRAGKTVKKFWKDFVGTVKKVVWPGPKQVFKSSLVVLVAIIVSGLVVFGVDQGLTALFRGATNLAISAGEQLGGDEEAATVDENAVLENLTEAASDAESTEEAATSEAASDEAATAAEETTAEETTAEGTPAEETTAAEPAEETTAE